MICKALRLHPGEDLTEKITTFVKTTNLKSAFIITCVGSVTCARLRMANADVKNATNEMIDLQGRHEIVSLVGTVCQDGAFHLHTSLSDKDGKVIGGHVVGNMKVFTTAELVIGSCTDFEFKREYDSETGFDELIVK